MLLNKWNTLPILLFWGISAVKITILPKLKCLFETLPVSVPKGELRAMQMTIHHFIWTQKRHSISKRVLLASKSKGGLVVPDSLKYYWSMQLRRVPAWSSLFANSRWMEVEKLWLAPIY